MLKINTLQRNGFNNNKHSYLEGSEMSKAFSNLLKDIVHFCSVNLVESLM